MAPSRRTDPTPLLQRAAQALQAGDLVTAERASRSALKAAPGHPGGLHLLGLTARRAGHADAAVDLFRKAVSAAPGYAEAWVNLGRALLDRLDTAAAAEAFEKALAARPGLLPAQMGMAAAHKAAGAPDQAEAILREAAAQHGEAGAPRLDLGNLLQEQDRHADAIEAYTDALTAEPGLLAAQSNRAAARLKTGDAAGALADAEAYLATGARSMNVVAYRVLALQFLGRWDEAKEWCDPATMVFPVDPHLPADFAAAFEADIRAHPTLTEAWDPQRRAARGGKVTAELMSHPTDSIRRFEQAVRAAVDALRERLPVQDGHPLFGAKPAAYHLTMWANILAPGGQQAAHIHNLGWVSGVYYPTLPDTIGQANDEGWIAFGEPGYGLPAPEGLQPLSMQPLPGQMFIFPSYLWHHTVPLQSGAERISVAFDVVPA